MTQTKIQPETPTCNGPCCKAARKYCAHRDATVEQTWPGLHETVLSWGPLPRNVTSLPKRIMSEREIVITEKTPETLVAELAQGELKSVDVARAFLNRAALAQELVNCITELLPDEALQRAQQLDDYFQAHGKPIGPLHGLPISVKEHMAMKDKTHDAGWCAWAERRAEENSHILDILWNAGAVFYARTTQPQALMQLETDNNLTGVTVNPFNRDLTCGGSSGGEGALIGFRGSCLGVGTDIGGSIRSPCANQGLYGLRPSALRLPLHGKGAIMLGNESILGVIGPMSTSLEGVKLFVKTILAAKPWLREPSLLAMPWRDDVSHFPSQNDRPRIRVGVMWNDGVVQPHPPIRRAMETLVQKLEKVDGVELVPWKPYKHAEAWQIISQLYYVDGGATLRQTAAESGELVLPMTEWILSQNKNNGRVLTPSEIWTLTRRREAYRMEYADHWNQTATETGDEANPVDVILCPAGPGAAPPHGHARYWTYTAVWNLLDYPAMVFPVTAVDPELDQPAVDFMAMNYEDEWNSRIYKPELYADAPVSLQLVARRHQDEKVVEALEYLQQYF
ncbi:amidase [Aspergillus sclerotiicarbonarius CBS 121057]|uniref:amidase n=1 Tax=Aspergillus sclerotiicarbonarius (strain CBS 121057 / IBT 28362) TaxID=1448318 RepID=A0A319ELK2_ASPSB|nr:amidase [Aspergillus sclerotiicarbonarius CBS 121057]